LGSFKGDELVKTLFSRKAAKNAKKKPFNIRQLTLRLLRLCVRFGLFTKPSKVVNMSGYGEVP